MSDTVTTTTPYDTAPSGIAPSGIGQSDRPLRLAVVVGSTREGRLADTVARWFTAVLAGRSDFELDLVDLRDVELPAVQAATHPKSGRYSEPVARFAERIGAADGYVLVTPEYNHGYPAALKTALDAVYAEWNAKPAGFVSYGGASGGLRAVEQLRQVLGELHVVALRDAVAIPFAGGAFDQDGGLADTGAAAAAKVMLDSLQWWGRALRTAREHTPYGG